MRIGLIDVDGHNFPNLSLMKLSAYHKNKGDTVEWYKYPNQQSSLFDYTPWYDIVYMSKVFSDQYSPDIPEPENAAEVIRGGSGYAIKLEDGIEVFHKELNNVLPYEIEHIYPDYSIYPEFTGYGLPLKNQTAYGFLSRGCPRGCKFCHVAPKEGQAAVKVADLKEFWSGQKNIVLLDNNILACPQWKDLLQQIIDANVRVEFNQGLDARLLTQSKADLLAQMDIKLPHFAMDNMKDKDRVAEGLKMYVSSWKKFHDPSKRGGRWNYRKARVYCIVGFDTTFQQDMERIKLIYEECECHPYIMIYNKPDAPAILRRLQRWCNNAYCFGATKDFFEYQKHTYKEVIYPDV